MSALEHDEETQIRMNHIAYQAFQAGTMFCIDLLLQMNAVSGRKVVECGDKFAGSGEKAFEVWWKKLHDV